MEKVMNSNWSSQVMASSDLKSDVLFIDNDLASYYLVYELLSDYPFNLIHARCGCEGIFAFKSYPTIGLVISELKLPKLDGYEVLKQIRKLNPGIPVWAQTAVVLASVQENCKKAGFNEFIEKPIDFNRFDYCVKNYIGVYKNSLIQ